MRKQRQSWYTSIIMMVSFFTIQCCMLSLVALKTQPIMQEIETISV